MIKKKQQKIAAIAVLLPLVLVFALTVVGCEEPGGGGGGEDRTELEGAWEGSNGLKITFSGSSFTRITGGSLDIKGNFSLSGDTVNFAINQYSTDGGNSWLNRDQYIDEMIKASVGESIWNSMSAQEKQLLRNQYISTMGLPPTTDSGEYELIFDGKQLIIIYVGSGSVSDRTVVYQKAGTSTVPTALVGKWVIEDAPTVIVLDFSTSQLRLLRGVTTYKYYTLETDGKIEIGTNPGIFTQDFCESYDITGGILTFTGGSSETWYPSASFKKYVFPPYSATALTADQWKNGEITSSNREVWYSFTVTSGTYYFWLNTGGYNNGDGWSKTLSNAQISAWYSDGTSIFTNIGQAWSNARTISPTSSTTVYVRVTPGSNTANGTYGVVYTTANTRPFDVPSNTTILTEGQWKDGAITSGLDDVVWYSFTVTGGSTYRLWWNESGTTYGDGSKTLNVSASAYYDDGTQINTNAWNDAWSTARTISPTSDGTVYVMVYPSTSGNTGTFGIVYSTTSTRPNVPFTPPANINITALTDSQWKDDEITTANGEAWYSFSVNSGTSYRLWWNEFYTYGSDYTKTLNIRVEAWHSNNRDTKVVDAYYSNWDGNPSWFTAASNGTVYVKVTPETSGNTGTYGIVYSTAATMPGLPINPTNIVALTERQWENGEIAAGGEAWYSFTVSAGTTYYLWWNGAGGSSYGDNTKTLRVRVTGYYSDGTFIFSSSEDSYNVIPPQSFTASSSGTGTVYFRVTSPGAGYLGGTFGIVYGTGSTSMPVP